MDIMINRRIFVIKSCFLLSVGLANPALAKGQRSTGKTVRSGSNSSKNKVAAALRSQSEKFGGHLNTRHVSKNRSFLKTRHSSAIASARSKGVALRKSVKRTTAKQEKYIAHKKFMSKVNKQRKRKYSTFRDGKSAEYAINQAVKQNRSKIKDFMRGNKKSLPLTIKSNTNLGTVYNGKTNKFTTSKNANIVLRKQGNRYYVHTGYPI